MPEGLRDSSVARRSPTQFLREPESRPTLPVLWLCVNNLKPLPYRHLRATEEQKDASEPGDACQPAEFRSKDEDVLAKRRAVFQALRLKSILADASNVPKRRAALCASPAPSSY